MHSSGIAESAEGDARTIVSKMSIEFMIEEVSEDEGWMARNKYVGSDGCFPGFTFESL